MSFTPLVQMLMTIQFQPALNGATLLDIAEIVGIFRDRFPDVTQVVPAGPMLYSFSQLEGDAPVESVTPTFARMRLASAEREELLLLQNDRLSFGWIRQNGLDEEAKYIGFVAFMERMQEHLEELRGVAKRVLGLDLVPVAGELAYTNALPLTDRDGTDRRLSSIFEFLNGATPILMRGWEFSWNEGLSEDGILAVKVDGPAVIPGNIDAGILQLTATFPTPALHGKELTERFTEHHDQLLATFKRIVKPERLLRY